VNNSCQAESAAQFQPQGRRPTVDSGKKLRKIPVQSASSFEIQYPTFAVFSGKFML
jgi:hypothetical protein